MRYLFLYFLFTLCCCQNIISQLVLVDNGKSNYIVTIKPKASSQEERAASIFRYFFKRATQVNLPISTSTEFLYRIHIETEIQLPAEGFRVYAQENHLFITGGGQNGVINGVWYVLRHLIGVDFFAVSELSISCPEQITFSNSFNVQEAPSFSTRTFHSLEGYDQDYQECQSLQVPYIAKCAFQHSFNTDFLPPSQYFKTSPDYYILWDGRRDTAQPNLQNEQVLQIALKKIRSVENKESGKGILYNINLNDNPKFDQFVRSYGNAKKIYANGYFDFVNKLASNIPSKKFVVLAYEQTKAASSVPALRPNIMLVLTNADNNKSKPITTDDYDVQQQLSMKQEIPAWLKKDPEMILWDYMANYTNSLMPWPNLYTLQPTLQYYWRIGIKNLFLQNAGRFPSENSELKAYLCANLMWNVNYDADSLIQNFCKRFYLKSWIKVYDYIHQINQQAFTGNESMYTYDGPVKFKNSLFTYSNITLWQRQLNEAEQNAESQLIKKRIMKERIGLDCVFLELSITQTGWNQKDNKTQLLQKLEAFRRETGLLQIYRLSESQPSVEQYINQLKQNLQ